MRFVVRYFVLLLDRFPGLAEGAYFLVAWIGLKLTISGLSDAATQFLGKENVRPFHIPEVVFWTGMVLIMILSFVIRPKQTIQETHDASEELDRLGSENGSDENGGAARENNVREDSQADRGDPEPGTDGGQKPDGPPDGGLE